MSTLEKIERRWTSEEARKLYEQLVGKIEEHNAAAARKVDRLLAAGRHEEAAKLHKDHVWDMQPLVDQAARLLGSHTVVSIDIKRATNAP